MHTPRGLSPRCLHGWEGRMIVQPEAIGLEKDTAVADAERDVPLKLTAAEFRRAGHDLVDMIAQFLESVPERPVARNGSPESVRALLRAGEPLPEAGATSTELLRSAADVLFDHSLLNGHPRFFGYITS